MVVSSRALVGQRALLLLAMMTMMILTTTTVDAVGTQLDDHPKYRKGIGTIVEDSYIVVLRPDPFVSRSRCRCPDTLVFHQTNETNTTPNDASSRDTLESNEIAIKTTVVLFLLGMEIDSHTRLLLLFSDAPIHLYSLILL